VPDQPAAAAKAFTERGTFAKWLCTHTRGASRLSVLHLPGSPTGEALKGSADAIADCSDAWHKKRGNLALTEQTCRPTSWSLDQWLAFAGLRAYPNVQFRRLTVALQDDTLLLESPQVCSCFIIICKHGLCTVTAYSTHVSERVSAEQGLLVTPARMPGHNDTSDFCLQVCAAIRMVMYHVGQLECKEDISHLAQVHPGNIKQTWLDSKEELSVLCSVLLHWQQRLLHAPKFLLKVCPTLPLHSRIYAARFIFAVRGNVHAPGQMTSCKSLTQSPRFNVQIGYSRGRDATPPSA
jgi:hypothetical protein